MTDILSVIKTLSFPLTPSQTDLLTAAANADSVTVTFIGNAPDDSPEDKAANAAQREEVEALVTQGLLQNASTMFAGVIAAFLAEHNRSMTVYALTPVAFTLFNGSQKRTIQ